MREKIEKESDADLFDIAQLGQDMEIFLLTAEELDSHGAFLTDSMTEED